MILTIVLKLPDKIWSELTFIEDLNHYIHINKIRMDICKTRIGKKYWKFHNMSAIEGNMIRVGKKPVMNYVMACVTLFNSGSNEIIIRARGKAITKAVDIAQMLRRSFTKGLIIKSIKVGSEDIKRMQEEFPISTIEIVLMK